MSDQTRPGDQPEPDEEADAHIRALLAELGSGPTGQAMPAEVAARLDQTLARLVTERSPGENNEDSPEDRPEDGPEDSPEDGPGDSPGHATVVPLRRRWLPRTAAVAAAVIVVGLGGVTAANLGVFGGGSSSDKAASSDAGGSTAARSGPESAQEPTPAQPRESQAAKDSAAGADGRALDAVKLPSVRAAAFASDVTTLLGTPGAVGTPEEAETSGPDKDPIRGLKAITCPGPVVTDGSVNTPVRYDGRLAALVVHPEQDGARLVEAWTCAGDRRLTVTTLGP